MAIQLQENLVVADRFRLVRMIGRGGMGSVWQAVHLSLDQPCALKFIEGELGDIAEAHARFEREAKAAAQLRSPHVVQILDHGVWQGRPYIAMELLDGQDLGRALAAAGGRLPPAEIVSIMQQVCRGLGKAHQAGIVHRDLKPDNIFLVNDDDRKIVKILDFGVAKQTTPGLDGGTKTGAMIGTPYFMSPEQAQGVKTIDARSDLWSLAVIVYLCMTGERPFDSDALGDLLVKIIVQPAPVPSTVAPVPPGFDAWWLRAAARNPDARFPTAKEFATSLAAALGIEDPSNVTRPLGHTPSAPLLQGTAVMSYPTPPQPLTGPQHFAPNPGPPTPQPTPQPPTYPTPPGQPPSPFGASGNPATFSGVEPPAGLPKRGAPVGLIALGVAILLGVVGAGLIVARGSSSHASGSPSSGAASHTGVSTATGEAPPPTASTAAVVPSATEVPVESDAGPAAKPVPPTVAATAAAPTTHGPATGPATRPTANTTASTPVGTAPAASTAKRPSMGDDRKW